MSATKDRRMMRLMLHRVLLARLVFIKISKAKVSACLVYQEPFPVLLAMKNVRTAPSTILPVKKKLPLAQNVPRVLIQIAKQHPQCVSVVTPVNMVPNVPNVPLGDIEEAMTKSLIVVVYVMQESFKVMKVDQLVTSVQQENFKTMLNKRDAKIAPLATNDLPMTPQYNVLHVQLGCIKMMQDKLPACLVYPEPFPKIHFQALQNVQNVT